MVVWKCWQGGDTTAGKFPRLDGGAGVKLHFYIDSDDDAERCKESVRFRTPIVIGGTDTLTGRVKSYSGVILAVDAASAEAPGERWRVTIDAA